MQIVIEKDSATKIGKECTEEQAAAYAAEFSVSVVNEDGSVVSYADWLSSAKPSDADGLIVAAADKAFADSGLSKAKWNKLSDEDRDALIQAALDSVEG